MTATQMHVRVPPEASACTGKRQYRRRDAIRTMRRMNTAGNQVGCYRCPWCSCWHIGHRDRWWSDRLIDGRADRVRTEAP